MNFFKKKLTNQYLIDIFSLGSGSFVAQILIACTSPFLTRLYDPSDVGLFGLVFSFVSIASIATSLRLETFLVACKDHDLAISLLLSCLLIVAPISMLFVLIYLGMINQNFLSFGLLPSWSSILVFILLVAIGIFSVLRYWEVRNGAFRRVGVALIWQGIGRSFAPLIFGLMNFGWFGILAGEIFGRSLAVYKLLKSYIPELRRKFQESKLIILIPSTIRLYWHGPVFMVPSGLLNAAGSFIAIPIFSELYGVSVSGKLFFVMQLTSLLSAVVTNAFADVFHRKISEEHLNCKQLGMKTIVANIFILIIISFIIFIPIVLFSILFFSEVFGKNWAEAGIYLAIICPVSMISLVISPISRVLIVIKKMNFKLGWDFLNIVFPVAGIYISHGLGGDAIFSVGIYSLISFLVYLVYLCMIIFLYKSSTAS